MYPSTYTEASIRALENLRNPDSFHWSIIPLFVLVVYAYFGEIEKRRWNVVLAGLGAYAAEWFAEIVNALWLHFSERSALWTTPGRTSYLLLVGVNVEITLMFALNGLIFAKVLPADRQARIWGLPARGLLVAIYAVVAVTAEVLLNRIGVLVWEYWWWNWPHVWSILLFAYAPYMIICFWIYDMKSLRTKSLVVAGMFAIDIACLILFIPVLKWI
jgi:hypothetical protein